MGTATLDLEAAQFSFGALESGPICPTNVANVNTPAAGVVIWVYTLWLPNNNLRGKQSG